LAAALCIQEKVTIRLQHPDDLPGGAGGRAAVVLWKAASRIEVADESMRADLVGILGPLGDRVSVVPCSGFGGALRTIPNADATPRIWGEGTKATAAQVQAVVRARAAAQREALAARRRLPIVGGGASLRVPQWQWLPPPGAGVPDLGPIPVGTVHGGTSSSSPSQRWSARSVLAAAAHLWRRGRVGTYLGGPIFGRTTRNRASPNPDRS
jgi:hypothetical protein